MEILSKSTSGDFVIITKIYGWDPRTKVIACAARVMCAKEFAIERYFIFNIIANMGFVFWLSQDKAC